MLRRLSLTCCLTLLASLLAAVTVLATARPAGAATFAERWCADGFAKPCVLSATRNGVPLSSSSPDVAVEMIGFQTGGNLDYFAFLVDALGATELDTGDVYSVLVDTGQFRPDSTSAFAGVPDVDRLTDPDGTYRIRYTAKPVVTTEGCDDSDYPVVCPHSATSESVQLSVEVERRPTAEFRGFDSAQNADSVNGIFLETAGDGSRYLSSEWANSHFRTDGTTVVKGAARFRIPYAMLHDAFDVPDPETLVPSSLAGSVNNQAANVKVFQDPDGGGLIVDISGVTFSRKVVRVRRGVIVPTRPTLTAAARTAPARARLAFDAAKPRGARASGYQGRCQRPGDVATSRGRRPAVVVTGLTPGRSYRCAVRALSKAGPGPWSRWRSVARQP